MCILFLYYNLRDNWKNFQLYNKQLLRIIKVTRGTVLFLIF